MRESDPMIIPLSSSLNTTNNNTGSGPNTPTAAAQFINCVAGVAAGSAGAVAGVGAGACNPKVIRSASASLVHSIGGNSQASSGVGSGAAPTIAVEEPSSSGSGSGNGGVLTSSPVDICASLSTPISTHPKEHRERESTSGPAHGHGYGYQHPQHTTSSGSYASGISHQYQHQQQLTPAHTHTFPHGHTAAQQQSQIQDLDSGLDMPPKDERERFLFYQDEGGFRATDEEDREIEKIYYLGVIDILTPWGVKKKIEGFWKGLRDERVSNRPLFLFFF
jgi:hypothetical protein